MVAWLENQRSFVLLFFNFCFFFTLESDNSLVIMLVFANLQGNQQNPEQEKAQDDAKRLVSL